MTIITIAINQGQLAKFNYFFCECINRSVEQMVTEGYLATVRGNNLHTSRNKSSHINEPQQALT